MMSYRLFGCLGLSASFLLSLAAVAPASVQTGLPDFEPNGGFSVHLKKGSDWQKIGFLRFDEFFREKGLNVPGEEGELHLRLVKEGKGVAHIDRVLLDGQGTLSVTGLSDPSPLGKLIGKDFDVVHFPEGVGSVELTFSGGGELLLAARVEDERLDETPFRFPQANQKHGITSIENFYSYTPSTQPTMVFSEGTAPGTGHPWGRTSVVAQVRGDRLELALDFEADNTLDGGKDYASLHVRSGETIQTYTVSQNEQQWGAPHFTYTSGVPWQHKVYRFSLPLAEFQAEPEKPLQLAFSAYGTAGPGPYSPVLAYGSENNEYLVANYLFYPDGNSTIQSRRYNPAGTEVGTLLNVTTKDATSKTEPAVAYDSVNNRFLTLWVQDVGGLDLVHRQLVSVANASVADPQAGTGAMNQRYPVASFSSASNRYLMAWTEDGGGTLWDIKGQLVNPNDNHEDGNVIDICSESGSQNNARIAYNRANDFFLVVWDDTRNLATSGTDIYGRLVKADGTPLGISTSISSAPGSQNSPDIAFDPDRNRSLVVWQDSRNSSTSEEDVYGRFVGNGLVQQGDEFAISTGAGDQWGPRVGYAGNGRFLVIWEDRASSLSEELHGRWISSSGEMLSEEQVFVTEEGAGVHELQLAGDGTGNFLSIYSYADIAGSQIGTKKIVAPSFSRLFLLGLPAQLNGANK